MNDPLEQFRKNFYDTLQKEKEEKEMIIKQKQKSCWHILTIVGKMIPINKQERFCKKCGYMKLFTV